MPELDEEAYLWDWLCSAGPAMSGAAGAVPLSATELQAWASGHGIGLDTWEFAALMRASRAYCAELQTPGDYPPFGNPDDLYDDDVIEQRLRAGLDGL